MAQDNEKGEVVSFPLNERSISTIEHSEEIEHAIRCIANKEFYEARDILTRLVDFDVNDAHLYLGQVYELAPNYNPILDYEKAHYYYIKSIELTGAIEAHLSIARMLLLGNLGSPDPEGALEIYMYLIGEGLHANGFLFFIVGAMYMIGDGVTIDTERAEEYLRKACWYEHIPSMTLLSTLLFRKKSYLEATFFKVRSIPLVIYYGLFDEYNYRTRIN